MQVKYQSSATNFQEYVPHAPPIYGAGSAGLQNKMHQTSALVHNYQGSSLMNQTYAIKFEVAYPTKFGESIGVIGSTEELGNWKQVKLHLKWTEGHLWTSKEPFITRNNYF